MTYQVLARRWRPHSFEEMVGQAHVVGALSSALDNDRVHHAYLFSGTRGVGKTTVARILAKALNCEQGVSSHPCGRCSACEEIDNGCFVDLIEVDAASRTGVDDTRDLLENVQYAPARGRYKVYLIDEVHMFSRNSFNALLKTLEEPPPHVKFLLATTDPRKLPVTVLSRCLQFNLRSLPAELIATQLQRILEQEGIGAEPAALKLLARGAAGSMRDGLSLLDQAIAYGGGQVTADSVADMLGTIDHRHVQGLLEALAAEDAKALLAAVAELDTQAPDYTQVLADMLHDLQRIAVIQVGAGVPGQEDPVLSGLSESLSVEDVQLYYQIALIGRRDLPLAPAPRIGFEMLLLRMLAFRPIEPGGRNSRPRSDRVQSVARSVPAPDSKPSTRGSPTVPASTAGGDQGSPSVLAVDDVAAQERRSDGLAARALAAALGSGSPAPEGEKAPVVTTGPGLSQTQVVGSDGALDTDAEPEPVPTAACFDAEGWERLLTELELDGMARQLAAHCLLESIGKGVARVLIDEGCDHLRSESAERRFGEVLGRRFGGPLQLRFKSAALAGETPAGRAAGRAVARQQAAEDAIANDPNVAILRDRFGAVVRPGSITPPD